MTDHAKPRAAAAKWLMHVLRAGHMHEILRDMGAGRQEFLKGFAFSPQAAEQPVVRNRVLSGLSQYPELLDRILELPDMPWSPWQDALAAFSHAYLLDGWRDLARGPYGRHILFALCLHPDLKLRARARRSLRRRSVWELPAETGAVAAEPLRTLPKYRSPRAWTALQQLMPAMTPGTAPAPAAMPAGATLTAELEKLQRENSELRKRHDKRRQVADEEAQTVAATRKASDEERRQQQRELRAAQDTIRQLEAGIETRAQTAAEAKMAEFRCQVLGLAPEFTARARATAEADRGSLPARLDALLARQRQLNEKHAHLEAVRQDIRQLQEYRTRLAAAMAESVIVLPELEPLDQEIQSCIATRLQTPGLTETAFMSPLAQQLVTAIAKAPADDRGLAFLAKTEAALTEEPLKSCLELTWHCEVRKALTDRREFITRLQREKQLAAMPSPVLPQGPHRPHEIWHLSQALLSLPSPAPVCLLVDGYNVIKLVPDLERLEKAGLAAARDMLVQRAQAKAKLFAAVELVFDGQGAVATRETRGPVTVVFSSGREADQNADNYIVTECTRRAGKAEKLWLVTADTGLRHRVQSLCAGFIAPADFYAFVRL